MLSAGLNTGLDQVGGGKRNVVGRAVVFDFGLAGLNGVSLIGRGSEAVTCILHFGTSKARKSIGAVGSGDKPRLAEIVLGLEVADLGLVWSVDDTNGNREDGVAL